MELHDCEQYSDTWWSLRLGIPTASEFSTVLAKGRGNSESKMRRTYLLKLAGERLTGEPMDNYTNADMERGHLMEDEARKFYAFMKDVEPEQVGFIRNGDKGASPDALLGDDGLLEIKTTKAHLLLDLILKDLFPSEHMAQCQGQLWVAEREWLDLAVYSPKLPLFVKRIQRDEEYIAKLSAELAKFNAELNEMVEKVQALNGEDPRFGDAPEIMP